ncbi:MAG: hypothetical protein PVH69_10135, partial [Desulfobacterales bacterium]
VTGTLKLCNLRINSDIDAVDCILDPVVYRLPDDDFGTAERGSRISHTSTSDNVVQNLYMEA